MAKPIKETPILFGEDARRFEVFVLYLIPNIPLIQVCPLSAIG